MRRHILLGFQPGRQFRHRYVCLGFHSREQSRQMRSQLAAIRGTTTNSFGAATSSASKTVQVYKLLFAFGRIGLYTLAKAELRVASDEGDCVLRCCGLKLGSQLGRYVRGV